MLRRIFCIAIIGVVLLTSPVMAARHKQTAVTTSSTLSQFDTEGAAQEHCPKDTVVWLNTRTGVWHEKGMRWYGRTREGAYVCEREAAAAGDRDTMNGQ